MSQLNYEEFLAQVKALAVDPHHDWSPAELQELAKNMQTVLEAYRVPMTAYGWTFAADGELHGLTAGDMGYEPSGLHFDRFTKDYLDKLEAQAKLGERLDKEVDRLISYFPSDPFTDEVVDLTINTIESLKRQVESERNRAEKNLQDLDRVLDAIAALMLILTGENDIVAAMKHLTPETPDIVALAETVVKKDVIHLGVYGEQGADDVPTACGQSCSTWDKPLRYSWELDEVTCLACLRARARK